MLHSQDTLYHVLIYNFYELINLPQVGGGNASTRVCLFVSRITVLLLWAEVQPTLDPCPEAFVSRPIALAQAGEEFG